MEVDKTKESINFGKTIVGFQQLNENFTKAKCYILALGKNANKSHFGKDAVDAAYPSLFFVPVIGHLMETDDGKHYLGGHDYKFDKDKLEFKSLCVPFGVAIPSQEPNYETVVESDGTVNTYLTTDIILWTGRYPELKEAIYSDKIMFGQSMEVYFNESKPLETDTSYTDIISFSFDALCMLNKSDDVKFNVTPCFPSASIVKADYSLDKDAFNAFFEELKTQLKSYFTAQEGGTDLGADNTEPKNYVAEFSATYEKKRGAICEVLSAMYSNRKNDSGDVVAETRYYLIDFDENYVFVRKEEDSWDNGSYNYTNSNWRVGYTYDDENMVAALNGEPEEVFHEWLTREQRQQLETKVAQFEETIATMVEEHKEFEAEHEAYVAEHSVDAAQWAGAVNEINELRQFKANVEAERRQAQIAEIFAKYEERIGEMEEFIALKGSVEDKSLEDIDSACLQLVGKFAMTHPLNQEPTVTQRFARTSVDDNIKDNVAYGGLVEKYTNK